MERIHFHCDCGAALAVDPRLAGGRVRCPRCDGPVDVPEGAEGSEMPARGGGDTPRQRSSAPGVEIQCACGAVLNVPPHLIGEGAECAECGKIVGGARRAEVRRPPPIPQRRALLLPPRRELPRFGTLPRPRIGGIGVTHRIRRRRPAVSGYSFSRISPKSRLVAALLCFFLGGLGIHRFYVGKIGTGILQLFLLGLFLIWALFDFIMILAGSFTDKEGLRIVNWEGGAGRGEHFNVPMARCPPMACCPYCREIITRGARLCKHCGSSLG